MALVVNTYGGTTWIQIKDRFLLAAGDAHSAGDSGGSADAIVVSHYHTADSTLKAESSGGHTHTVYIPGTYPLTTTDVVSGEGIICTSNPYTTSTTQNGEHTHDITGNTSTVGSSGTGANMPPFKVVYVWERTA